MTLRTAATLLAAGISLPAGAAELALQVEIPRLKVAEYHRPYVAVWLERADQSFAAHLAVWYDLKMRDNEGVKWLKDLRSWWRKSGRELTMPADGLSSATRAPGTHTVQFAGGKSPLAGLPAGSYQLVVEAAREVGGREQIKLPFTWPPTAAAQQQAQGQHELGRIAIELKP